MGFYVQFKDESVHEAISSHKKGGYGSIEEARRDVNAMHPEDALPFKVIDETGQSHWEGKTQPPSAQATAKDEERGFTLIMTMVQLARSGKSYRHLLKELKPIVNRAPKVKEMLDLLIHNLEQ